MRGLINRIKYPDFINRMGFKAQFLELYLRV